MKNSGYYLDSDGINLFFRVWEPESSPRALLCIVHGLGDHSGCFSRLAEYYCSAGYGVYAIDMYGNGRSGGKRGDIPSFETFHDETSVLLEEAGKRFPGTPLILYGHSLGGLIVLSYTLFRKPEIAGAVASSPWLDLPSHPRLYRILAYTLDTVYPRFTLDTGVNTNGMTHDEEFAKEYINDPYAHGKITGRLLAESFRYSRKAFEQAGNFPVPLLVMHGGEDKVTDIRSSRSFAEKAGERAEFKLWEGARHTLHNEIIREQIYDYVIDWISNKTTDNL